MRTVPSDDVVRRAWDDRHLTARHQAGAVRLDVARNGFAIDCACGAPGFVTWGDADMLGVRPEDEHGWCRRCRVMSTSAASESDGGICRSCRREEALA